MKSTCRWLSICNGYFPCPVLQCSSWLIVLFLENGNCFSIHPPFIHISFNPLFSGTRVFLRDPATGVLSATGFWCGSVLYTHISRHNLWGFEHLCNIAFPRTPNLSTLEALVEANWPRTTGFFCVFCCCVLSVVLLTSICDGAGCMATDISFSNDFLTPIILTGCPKVSGKFDEDVHGKSPLAHFPLDGVPGFTPRFSGE